jgi:hypothetical protein
MAYYEHLMPGKRERIPEGKAPSMLRHRSMKGLNVVAGECAPGDFEHGMSPIVKVGLAIHAQFTMVLKKANGPHKANIVYSPT